MPKVWTDDTALMEGMTDNLFEALYKMPKYFLRIDDIAHSLEMPISSLLVLCVLTGALVVLCSLLAELFSAWADPRRRREGARHG